MKTAKERLDQLLVNLNLTKSRTQAQALIRAGEVTVDGQIVDKPGISIPLSANIQILSPSLDVSRGAAKLRSVLDQFTFRIEGRIAADLGASTGGFTQVLLERGASRVETFDVGYGLLHERLRADPRVVIHDRVNVRYLTGEEMEPAGVVVMDLSFIGLELVLPSAYRISAPDADLIALVKPQFEAGRFQVGKGGIVRNPKIHQEVLERHLHLLEENRFACWKLQPSGTRGKSGNQEYFSWFRKVEFHGYPEEKPNTDITEV